MFTELVGSTIILRRGGTFFQAVLYKREGSLRVYAKLGTGYIRIGAGDATSNPKVAWEEASSEYVKVSVKPNEYPHLLPTVQGVALKVAA